MKKTALLLCLLFLCATGCAGPARSTPPSPPQACTPAPTERVTPSPRPTATPTAPLVRPLPAQTPTPSPAAEETGTPVPIRTPAPAPPPVPTQIAPPAVPPAAPTPTPATGSTTSPTDEAVLAAYSKAAEAYGWFELAPLPTGAETREQDGITYARVDYPGIATCADLRNRLRTLFSDEIVDDLFARNTPRYTDFDGVLYAVPGGRGSDIGKGGETGVVLWETASKCAVQVTVQLLDPLQTFAVTGSETHRFPYERVGEKWIFTNFYLFR